ncbi:hypothetical protein V5799_022268 [Amblyomma americanum]|uniref:Secreted protein n=1 Tax=Amblyomma americanum TaxID=6943 RepID=A0AAQ4FML9_AMBAM
MARVSCRAACSVCLIAVLNVSSASSIIEPILSSSEIQTLAAENTPACSAFTSRLRVRLACSSKGIAELFPPRLFLKAQRPQIRRADPQAVRRASPLPKEGCNEAGKCDHGGCRSCSCRQRAVSGEADHASGAQVSAHASTSRVTAHGRRAAYHQENRETGGFEGFDIERHLPEASECSTLRALRWRFFVSWQQ